MYRLERRFRSHQRSLPPALAASTALLAAAVTLFAASPRVIIAPSAGFSVTWDGNNAGFSSADPGAGPSNNVALASNGTVAFTSSDLGPVLSIPFHVASNLNDGLYGNANSWISANGIGGTSDANPYAALRFAASVNVSSIAWGRDNVGTFSDRAIGIYTLQYTTVANPDGNTADTGDAATGWATIGTVEYTAGAESADFTSYRRHRFDVAAGGQPIAATGVRIKVSNGSMAIDEIEVNPIPDPVPPISSFIEIAASSGFAMTWDRNEGLFSTPSTPARVPVNDASASRGASAFGSSQVDLGVHFIANVNDGLYGNAHSWIPDFIANPDPAPYVGINFGRRILLRNLAWGRDNGDAGDCCGGTLTDRALGVYVVQVTTAPNPGLATPDACGPDSEGGWVTVGTINFKANHPTYFNSHLRHRFDLAQGGAPIPATAVRIKVPSNTSDIDEIEVNGNLAIEQNSVRITNSGSATIVWDGNDGHFNNPAVGAASPTNRALATAGATAFTSSDLGPLLGIPFHVAANLNDGLYGNSHSWISANGVGGTTDAGLFAGINFGGTVLVTNIAWGRDNGDVPGDCCGGTATDRVFDTYRLQFTMVAAPDASTADTGDAATGWQDLGTVTYGSAALPFFTPHLRHRFDVSDAGAPLEATGIRIKIANGNTAIDEIEVNTATVAPPPAPPITLAPAAGYTLAWDGNDGHFNNPALIATAPANRALATAGTTAFASSQLDFGVHFTSNVIDGRYGNANSWIPDFSAAPDPDPYIGLNFNGTVAITNLAWSRDNGNVVADCCGGTATDRVIGTYTLQVTTVENPGTATADTGDAGTGWETVGTINYTRSEPPEFSAHLRHRFELSSGGGPVEATGLRIKVSSNTMCIDEIEVNTASERPRPAVVVAKAGANAVVSWTGGGGLEAAPTVNGPWTCVGAAVSPHSINLSETGMRFFRIRR